MLETGLRPSAREALGETIAGLREWLHKAALPLWLHHGIDRNAGGFHEALSPDTLASDAPFRRLRVLTRQIFVFAYAHRAGIAGADAAVEMGIHFLRRYAAMPEGGYAWRFDLGNRPTDLTRDLYDHAFVLLALASATSLMGKDSLRTEALSLLAYLDEHFAHPAGGYVESLPPALPRRQNPHMHLLEALLAAHAAFGDGIFLARARNVTDLFLSRFLDSETGTLAEYFDDRLHVQRDGDLFVTEPGHHCEWAWLLHALTKHGQPASALLKAAEHLMVFVDRHGRHRRTGDLVGEVGSDGSCLQAATRIWPQTERLKAEILRPGATVEGALRAATCLNAWLLPGGLWHERRDAAGEFLPGPAPASSLYHLVCAIDVAAQANLSNLPLAAAAH